MYKHFCDVCGVEIKKSQDGSTKCGAYVSLYIEAPEKDWELGYKRITVSTCEDCGADVIKKMTPENLGIKLKHIGE